MLLYSKSPQDTAASFFFLSLGFVGQKFGNGPAGQLSGGLSRSRNQMLAGPPSPGGSTGLDDQVGSPGMAGG